MRKIFFTLVLSMAVITASFHAQVKHFVIKERKTNKSINIEVSASDSYRSNAYKYCEAKLDYTVLKIRGNQIDTVVQKEFPKFKLREVAQFANGINENIIIKDVVERKEQVVISYNVTYLSKGSVLEVAHERLIPKRTTTDSIVIKI